LKAGEIKALWADPQHWRWGLFYYCKADPRIIVPKRVRLMGWTFNFAHSRAVSLLSLTLAGVFLPFFVLWQQGFTPNNLLFWAAPLIVILALCVTCARMASPHRYED